MPRWVVRTTGSRWQDRHDRRGWGELAAPGQDVASIQRALTAIARRGRARVPGAGARSSRWSTGRCWTSCTTTPTAGPPTSRRTTCWTSPPSRGSSPAWSGRGWSRRPTWSTRAARRCASRPAARPVIAESMAAQREALQERLQGWTGAEVQRVRPGPRALQRRLTRPPVWRRAPRRTPMPPSRPRDAPERPNRPLTRRFGRPGASGRGGHSSPSSSASVCHSPVTR